MELTAALNAIAGTTGLEAQGAANVIAGTDGLALVGALNVAATPVGVVGYQPSKLRTPGGTGNYASCPRTAAIGSITGDLDARWVGSLDDWTPATYASLISRYVTIGNQRGWMLTINAGDGLPVLYWSGDGTAILTATATAAPTVANGDILGIRATLDVNNGAGGKTVTFYTSADLGETWVQLGSPVTSASTTSIFDSATTELEIGSRGAGTAQFSIGYCIRAEARNGINGTVVANPDFTSNPNDSDGYAPDAAGNTWTLHGTAALANDGAAIPSVSGESPRLELQGVLNLLGGTSGLGVNAAATTWMESL